ncbi:hypothetical protein LBMAG42_21130 [Deltaproteobacteria bacterium]|nr:hypothetical protein LBMAG42_21130 [Deltaproteobacteria bacterium]
MRPFSSLLLLAACAPQPNPDAALAQPPAAGSSWSVELTERVEVANAAIGGASGVFSANIARLGGGVTFDSGGATVSSRSGTMNLRVGQFGRAGAERELASAEPYLGEGVPGLVGPDGALSRRLTYAHDGLSEWFVGAPEGLEHGWTLEERPDGAGAVRFGIDTDATLLDVSMDVATWLDDAGSEWRYADPAAFDATGEPLDIWFSAEGNQLVVNVDDTGATYPIEIDPVLTTADVTLTGPSASGRFGESVSSAGDVNNDGYDDVIVGASRVSSNTGRAYVYHGSATGLSTTASTTLSGGYSSGSTPYYYCGGRVAGGGDVNNDGYDDVLMACIYNTASVQVFHGSASGVSTTASTTLTGTKSTNFGYGLALVPSVDADDYADVVVGAPATSSYRGTVTVYAGSASGVSSTASVSLTGVIASYFGLTIHNAGDVNNDGYNDIAVGAPVYLVGYGRVSVYYGSSTGITATSVAHLYGSSIEGLGTSLAGGGDFNGDGYDDIAAGTFESSTGHAYVYEGSSSGISTTAAATLTGGAYFGSSLALLPDVDADGYADMAVGAPGTEVSVFRGSASGVATTSVADVSESGTYYGYSLDGADVDGDGYTDLIVGDYSDSTLYGKVYVYMGYADDDGDGYGGGGADATDCDDADATVFPGATETTGDGVDQNCDGEEECLSDNDDDGYLDGSGSTVTSSDSDCDDAGEGTTTDPTTDCDDSDASVNPGAAEGIGDEQDQDCDGAELCFDDDDGDETLDTSGDSVASTDLDCDDPGEGTTSTPTTDCDDTDALINTSAVEIAGDEVDQDCDGGEICYSDADGDGYQDGSTVVSADASCTGSGEATATDPAGDCDDGDAGVNPGADEECDAALVDENCDGLTNDPTSIDASTWYTDADGDGYGDASLAELACDAPTGTSANGEDCDDTDADVSPVGIEVCGGTDEDCDGLTDDADPDVAGTVTLYTDADGDGYGDASAPVSGCAPTGSVVENDDDCDDADALVNPSAAETVADGIDQDCDGGDACHADADGDGYRGTDSVVSADLDCADAGEADATAPSDCDDDDASVNPSAAESAGDGVDQDCDLMEACYNDADADGYRDSTTFASANLACDGVGEADAATPDGDCDDADANSYPGATEVVADEIDENCDGAEDCYADVDEDGYLGGTTVVTSVDSDCSDPGEGSLTSSTGDCNDADAAYHPGAAETDCSDPSDYNCDGATGYDDIDGDGWAACEECDDTNTTVNPDATEAAGDGVDQNCDGLETCFVDADGDGHRPDETSTTASTDTDCRDPGEATDEAATDDCNDADASIVPGATELPGDGVDQDCDGLELCYVDGDGDAYRADDTTTASADADCDDGGEAAATTSVGDCDDADAAYHPGAAEADCEDPNDYNCDGSTGLDDLDGDGFGACEECNDALATVNPDAIEICNGLDDDCSGAVDDHAVDAATLHADNDGDGYGNPTVAGTSCSDNPGYVEDGTDCDDGRSDVYPGADDPPGDGIDQNCDGSDGITEDTGGGDTADDLGDSGDLAEARVGGLFGGCDSAGGAGLAIGGVLLAAAAGLRRRSVRRS